MSTKTRLKNGDKVMVLSGKHRGDSGEIFKIDHQKYRAYVKGLNLVKRHMKPTKENPGKIDTREASIHLSNLALLDPKDGKPTKIGYKFSEDNKKIRFAKLTGGNIDG